MSAQDRDENGHVFPLFRRGTVQKITYTGTAGVIANAVSAECQAVLIWCGTDAHIAIGAAPVAVAADDWPITGKVEVMVRVEMGESFKVSAIQQSAGGTLYVTELL